MRVLRTPDECFANLSDYDFQPHYMEVPDGDGGQLRIHWIDEGPSDGQLILCMHGQPSWSYLYRKMIPVLTAAGHRVICPDLVGFGKSDKPTDIEDYSYQRHVDWMSAWLTELDLSGMTLVCQDWGGLIGLRLVAAFEQRFARVVVANTGLPDGRIPPEGIEEMPLEMAPMLRQMYDEIPVVDVEELGERFAAKDGPPGFFFWRKFAAEHPDFSPRELLANSINPQPPVSDEQLQLIADAYGAPFPDSSYLAGARKFPSLVPIFPDDPAIPANREAWEVLRRFDKPFLTAFSDNDPVTAGGDARFLREVPGCKGVEHLTIEGAGHFLQEDQPVQFAQAIAAFMAAHS